MNYTTKTFIEWWRGKLEGFQDDSPPNHRMNIGTLLEHDIIDLYERLNGVKGLRDHTKTKGMARANTDLLLEDEVIDIKVTSKAVKWHFDNRVPIQYRRQLYHYCYVHDFRKGSIVAYQTDEELLNNPFQPLNEHKLFEIPVQITDGEIEEHREKLEYLEWCRDEGIYPN